VLEMPPTGLSLEGEVPMNEVFLLLFVHKKKTLIPTA
jgi:hypothetical protein